MTTRAITQTLAEVLDALDASERRLIEKLSLEYGVSTLLGRVLRGVAAECRAIDQAEAEVIAALEADHRAETEQLAAEADWPTEPPC